MHIIGSVFTAKSCICRNLSFGKDSLYMQIRKKSFSIICLTSQTTSLCQNAVTKVIIIIGYRALVIENSPESTIVLLDD